MVENDDDKKPKLPGEPGDGGGPATAAGGIIDPQRSYDALGRFIERRSPYEGVKLPNFGAGNLAGDDIAMDFEDNDPDMLIADKHVFVERGRYAHFNAGNVSNLKADKIQDANPGFFPEYDLGGGVKANIVKELQIHYKHKRHVDGKDCYVAMVVLYLGDAH